MSDKAEEPLHSITTQPSGNTKTRKSKASNSVLGKDKHSDYHERQTQNCKKLDKLCGGEVWHVENIISRKSHPKALEALFSLVQSASSCGIDTKDLLGPGGYFLQQWEKKGPRKMTELHNVIKEAQRLMEEKHARNIQGTTDQTDGIVLATVTADLEVEDGPKINSQPSDDGTDVLHQDDNAARPSGSSPTVEGSPRPCKKQKIDECVNLVAPSPPDDTECWRVIYYQKPALKIITLLENVERLNDDTVSYVSRILGLGHNGDPAEILSPFSFIADENKVPRKAKFVPQPNQNTFIPLHHRQDSHWTLCLLKLEEVVLSVHFCDPLKDKSRKDNVEKLFKSWSQKEYPEYQLSFHEKESFPQQKDDTSCGVFVLEAIRYLLVSQDVPESMDPREARAGFLRMICSFDTTISPQVFKDDELAVIHSVQEQLEERDISTLQDLVSTQPPPDARSLLSKFAEFKTPCSRLHLQIKQRCEQSTKELEHIRKELKEAEHSLVVETTKQEGANQALDMIFNTSAVEQGDLSLPDDGSDVDQLIKGFRSGLAKAQRDAITKDKEAARLRFEQAYLDAKTRVQNLTKEKDHLLSKVKKWEQFCQIFEALSFLSLPTHGGRY